jgi:2-dehydro-3-deoxyphosphogluconate aldolase/(4S)-4-hydroxy-2-oxoglutarate aldolase
MNTESEIAKSIHSAGVIAVLIVDDATHAVPLARALLEGGVTIMELTLRTPEALECLRRIRAEVPEMTAGVGTILSPDQVDEVVEAGAAFGVSPGTNPGVIRRAAERDLPFSPGVATPSDIEQALALNCRLLKLFPAEASGGLEYLKSMAAPYLHLGVRFIPLGGIHMRNLGAWLCNPLIAAVGGSWLAPREDIREEQWDRIRTHAREAAQLVANIRQTDSE